MTPTQTPTATSTNTPTAGATDTPTRTPTGTATSTATSTPTNTPLSCFIDSDGDGIADCNDPHPLKFDPAGYIYDEADGRIVPGGLVTVAGPGPVTLLLNGSTGRYSFEITTPGVYTLTVTPPPGYVFSSTCLRKDPPPFTPPAPPPFVVSLGNSENGNTGFLTSNACTPFYLAFNLKPLPGDPAIINSNIPLHALGPVAMATFPAWAWILGVVLQAGFVGFLVRRRLKATA